MRTIVITGSTRGIGLGLAREFIKNDCKVVISGRKQADVDAVVNELSEIKGKDHVVGLACDVSERSQVQALWNFAASQCGKVDIWINNAGTSHLQAPAWQIPEPTLHQVFHTNIDGLVNGCNVAFSEMLQQGEGSLYNMLGLGSDGRKVNGLSVYGTSKAAVRYYTDALIEEARNTPVIVGSLSPGMVLTDLLLKQKVRSEEEMQQMKKVYNLLADPVEAVTPWLAEQILKNKKHGVSIRYFTFSRMLQHLFDSFTGKRDISKLMEKSE